MTAKAKKRAKKVYPKIKLGSMTTEEFYAAYDFTPAEIRRAHALARKILDEDRRKTEAKRTRSATPRRAAR